MATALIPFRNSTNVTWADRRVVTFRGQYDTRIETGEDYDALTIGAIFSMKPAAQPKGSGPAFIPSTYVDHDAREHKSQRERGSFVALTGDIDTGDHPLEHILGMVRAFTLGAAWLIYSSPHARPGDMRWRIVLPLEEPLAFEVWHDAQLAFYAYMEAAGVTMDHALSRAAQPVYLPNVPRAHAKSGTPLRDDGDQPLYYESATSGTNAPGLDIKIGHIAQSLAALQHKRAEGERKRDELRKEAEKRKVNRPRGNGGMVIDSFNASNGVAAMLERFGYEQSPLNPDDWRSPHQSGDTFATRVIENKWISLSASDAAAGVGTSCASGCYGDAYDLFVHYEHDGDHKRAFRQLGAEHNRVSGGRTSAIDEDSATFDPADPGWQEMPDCASGGATEEGTVPREVPAAAEEADFGVSVGDFRAYMPAHNYIFTPAREFWPASSVNARLPPMKLLDARGQPVLDGEGKPKFVAAAAWLDKERPVEQLTWAPGEPMIVEGRLISEGGWINRPGCSCFNLYREPIVAAGDPNQAARWVEHVRYVYPNDADHIIAWLAQRVQRPQDKINHALVLGGNQGIGKDTLLEPAKYAVGPWNCSEVSPQQLLGRFNGFLKSVILRVSEARDLGDVDRYSFYEHMKTYTAAPPDVLRVDEKHTKEHSIFNVVGVIITTNNKTDGVYLPPDDRRHYVAWSDLTKDDFDEEYWTCLWAWYDWGGRAHVAAYLRTLDISGFNPKAPPPKTAAWNDIVASNRAPEDAELADALDGIGWPSATTLSAISTSTTCANSFADWLSDRRNSRKVPHRLEAVGYVAVHNPSAKDGLWKALGKRQAVYAKKDMSVRDRIAAADNLTTSPSFRQSV